MHRLAEEDIEDWQNPGFEEMPVSFGQFTDDSIAVALMPTLVMLGAVFFGVWLVSHFTPFV